MAKETKEKKKVKVETAKKRDIQNLKRRDRNRQFKSRIRTSIKRFEQSITASDAEKATEALNTVYSLMDKGVKIGVIKQNKASRTKSRLVAKKAALV